VGVGFSNALIAFVCQPQLLRQQGNPLLLEQAKIMHPSCGKSSTENLPGVLMHNDLRF
jgi:hypothetical protein